MFVSKKKPLAISLPESIRDMEEGLRSIGGGFLVFSKNDGEVRLLRDDALLEEAFRLAIDKESVKIWASGRRGLWNGMISLVQKILLAFGRQDTGRADSGDEIRGGGGAHLSGEIELPLCDVMEKPGMAVRGFLLDVSRGRIPKMEMLYQLADTLALLHYNHLELYIEGFSYAYSFHDAVAKEKDSLTGEELEALDRYCAARMIELVPCQNTLGHMTAWLEEPDFAYLAEATALGKKPEREDSENNTPFPPSTLNAADPGSLALVKKMLDDLLPHFQSEQVNVCLDEPFELGTGKSRLMAPEMTPDELYLSFVNKLRDDLASRGKRMLMWGDIAGKSPALCRALPQDVTLLEWGYDADHPFDRRAKVLKEAGLRFIICPGTSSWTSFSGITDNMAANVARAARAAYTYGAEGMILTDWGDFGHLQPISVSYPAMVLCSFYMWENHGLAMEELAAYLDALVLRVPGAGMGELMLSSGLYAQHENYRMECRTQAAMPLVVGMIGEGAGELPDMDRMAEVFARMGSAVLGEKYIREYEARKPFDDRDVFSFLEKLMTRWEGLELPASAGEAVLVREEYMASLCLVRLFTHIRRGLLEASGNRAGLPEVCCMQAGVTGPFRADGNLEEESGRTLAVQEETAIGMLVKTWEKRSRPGELEHTIGVIRHLSRVCQVK